MRRVLVFCCCLLLIVVGSVSAREIAGVDVPESVTARDGTILTLNGAGIRVKFLFKIYIAQLYLENPSSQTETVITDQGQKKIVMYFLYDEVTKEKLVDGWNSGFQGNLDQQQLAALGPRIEEFNAMFSTIKKGEIIELDYFPAEGTRVQVAGEERGVIEGKDFSDALLAIWLGEKPVTSALKKALLSGQ